MYTLINKLSSENLKGLNSHGRESLSNNFELNARFGLSKKNRPLLLIDNYTFICDAKTKGKRTYSSSWRCSNYVKYLCKARATTRQIGEGIKYKITYPFHTH